MCVQTNQSVLLTPTSEVESVPGDQPQAATVDSPPSTFIRVLIVDDHRAVRSALRAFLLVNDDLELVGEATDGLEALQLCERQQADVILMALLMPRMDGANATRAIRSRYPQIQVLILTGSNEKRLEEEAIQAGAVGLLPKEVTGDQLARAIRAAYSGHPITAAQITALPS